MSTTKMNPYLLAFITGLTTGGISCFVIQGGMLAAISNKKLDVIYFLAAKLIAYTALGFVLGLFGVLIGIPTKILAVIQILIGVLMILIAFKKYAVTAPKKFFRITRNQKAPAVLGALTILIPCGVSQAMMLQAIASGGAIDGALILFFFILGTSPLFFLLGISANKLLKNKYIGWLGTIAIIIIGVISIKNGLTLMGISFDKVGQAKTGTNINIEVSNNGYVSDVNTLKLGVPVTLTINTNNVISCARSFVIPDLNYSVILPQTGKIVYKFTPNKLGKLAFTCSMGMYSGLFNVIN